MLSPIKVVGNLAPHLLAENPLRRGDGSVNGCRTHIGYRPALGLGDLLLGQPRSAGNELLGSCLCPSGDALGV